MLIIGSAGIIPMVGFQDAALVPRFDLDVDMPDGGTAEIPCACGDELLALFASTYI
ncbi:hypothetical protein [Nocardia sp. CA-135398]|uniref:hypothetical protein n=1 Tax=Nocardia sp. CA-135398 TaxID=3239977 RepID=UPI003D97A68D